MSVDVCQALLHETKYGEFCLRCKPFEFVRNIQLDADATTLRQSIDIPAECGRQSAFVQHWWMQKIRSRAYFLGQILNQLVGIFDAFGKSRWVALRVLCDSSKGHPQCSEILASAVMQLTGNTPTFLVLSKHQFSRKVAKLVRLLKDLSISPLELLGSKLYLGVERIGEGPKTLFTFL